MVPAYALVAAGLVLLMPALTYTGMLMTENAFFPAVVLSCFAMAAALERPTLLHQALALGAIAFACTVRFQALALLAVYATALALKLVLDLRAPDGGRGFRYVGRELRRFWPTGLVLLVGVFGYVALKARQGASLETGLGSYGGAVRLDYYDLSNVFDYVVDHFAELTFAVGLIPVSALILLVGLAVRRGASDAAERAFLAVAASAFVLIVIEVGAFASRFALRIEERNMFSVAPLLFLALCLWLAKGMPRPLFLTIAAAVVPAALLFSLDLAALLNIGILSDTFALIPLLRLSGEFEGTDTVQTLLVIGGVGAATAFALLPRRAAMALPIGLALFLGLSSYSVYGSVRDHSRATLALTNPSDPGWIDERIGADARAAYVYGATTDLVGEAQVLWQTEFWNRSVGEIYRLGPPEPTSLPQGTAAFVPTTGRIAATADPARYVVAPSILELDGTRLAQAGSLSLYRVDGPARLKSALGGVYRDGWMGSFAALTHYASPLRPGRLSVRLSRAGWGGPSPPGIVKIRVGPLTTTNGLPGISRVTATRSWTARSGATRRFVLPTPGAPYRVEVEVAPTFSPSDFGYPDPRQLGVQLDLRPAA
jgi:hypothetical protein